MTRRAPPRRGRSHPAPARPPAPEPPLTPQVLLEIIHRWADEEERKLAALVEGAEQS